MQGYQLLSEGEGWRRGQKKLGHWYGGQGWWTNSLMAGKEVFERTKEAEDVGKKAPSVHESMSW